MAVSKRSVFYWLIVLALLGAWGYARVDPAFARRCQSLWSTYVTPVYEAGRALLQQRVTATEQEVVRPIGRRFDRRDQTGLDVYQQTLASDADDAAASADQALSPGARIAKGHAYEKHRREFGFSSRAEMAAHLDHVIDATGPPNVKHLQRHRVAYWHEATGSVVIVDPNTTDGGTAFKPNRGRAYFNNLR